jgi:excisionase family DNA binding protein
MPAAAPVQLAELPMLATPKQAAAVMGPTESQVRGLIRDGRLAHVLIGKRVMIPRMTIENFIAENTVTTCPDETKVHISTGAIGPVGMPSGTSTTLKTAAAGSAARALQIASSLKSRSPSSSTSAIETPGRVIPLRSS